VEEKPAVRMNLKDVIVVVSEAQRLYTLDQIDVALHLLHSVKDRLESVIDSGFESAPGERLHAMVWVMCVRGRMLSDRGMLIKAESQYELAYSLARRCEFSRHDTDAACFVDQLIVAGQGLANVQGWSDRPNEAIQTLKEVVRDVGRTHQMQGIDGFEGILADINFWGEELGYSQLADKYVQIPEFTHLPEDAPPCGDTWTEPLPILGEAYEAFEIEFSERVIELQEDETLNSEVELSRLNDILEVVSDWLILVPKSATVRRFELEMLLRKSCVEAQLLNDLVLYDSWQLIEQKYRDLVVDVPEYEALPRNMATRLCTLSAIVTSGRLPEKVRALKFYQFAIDREFDAFRMMESRKMAVAMTQADALVWIRLTNLMSYTYRNFGDGSREARRSATRLTKIRNSILRNLLKRDPRNEEGLRLRSDYGRVNSRVSLRALLFHSKWCWRIEAIE